MATMVKTNVQTATENTEEEEPQKITKPLENVGGNVVTLADNPAIVKKAVIKETTEGPVDRMQAIQQQSQTTNFPQTNQVIIRDTGIHMSGPQTLIGSNSQVIYNNSQFYNSNVYDSAAASGYYSTVSNQSGFVASSPNVASSYEAGYGTVDIPQPQFSMRGNGTNVVTTTTYKQQMYNTQNSNVIYGSTEVNEQELNANAEAGYDEEVVNFEQPKFSANATTGVYENNEVSQQQVYKTTSTNVNVETQQQVINAHAEANALAQKLKYEAGLVDGKVVQKEV